MATATSNRQSAACCLGQHHWLQSLQQHLQQQQLQRQGMQHQWDQQPVGQKQIPISLLTHPPITVA